jgi:hypothetical protein
LESNTKYSCFWNNCKFQTNDYKSYESHQSLHKKKIKLLDISGKSQTINEKNDYSIASKTSENSKTTKITGNSTSGKYHLILKHRNNCKDFFSLIQLSREKISTLLSFERV